MSITTTSGATPPQGHAAFALVTATATARTTTTRPFGVAVSVAARAACPRVSKALLHQAAHGFAAGYLLMLLGASVAGFAIALIFALLLCVPSGAVAR
jgi:predicted lipid-binding transport protein (Tim44 family)